MVNAYGVRCATALELMRSRYEAFARGDVDWLLSTWHPSTRPEELDLEPDLRWRALQIVDTAGGEAGDATGVVEFRASYRAEGGHGVLHERSRFVHERGRWFYVDGELL